MLATMAAGLLATPAAAASGSTNQAGKVASSSSATPRPAVSVSKTKASPSNSDECPTRVTFSSRIKVKAYGGKTTVAYRWLRGNGSKSAVKTFVLKGKGVKYVTVKESSTFKGGDLKGWQALQVLAPRKVTSAKGYFKVSCGDDEWDGDKHVVNTHTVGAQAWVDERNCEATLIGRITASGTRWVRYQWVVNGRVVDRDAVRVYGSRKVYHVIRPHENLRGWAVLQILDPGDASSNRAYFKISCRDWSPKVSASVNAPSNYEGDCPVTRTFTGTISASHGRGEVKYRWIRDGVAGGWQSVYFDGRGYGHQSRSVSDSWTASASGTSKRSIEIYGGSTSGTVEGKVTCKAAPPASKAWIQAGTSVKQVEAGCPAGSVTGTGSIYATGPIKLTVTWSLNGSVVKSEDLEFTSEGTKSVSFTSASDGLKGGNARFGIVGGGSTTVDYEAVCPKADGTPKA
ncbi:hypothetical protein CA984_04810 [Streptosporangium minutum]|uniref:Ig-like domain-containing protein n=2 Tax=Streptosporangium minutum TaxID=569862 RepID=A0A243RUU9_9ACTN|nr:hypothetical protein CA984_04810 [Streptosporangium minutum]